MGGGNQNYAGLQIDEVNGTFGWADYSSFSVMNVVCANKLESQAEDKKKTAKLINKLYSSGSSVTILSTTKLATNLTICEEFNLSIDLRLRNQSISEWITIFSLE